MQTGLRYILNYYIYIYIYIIPDFVIIFSLSLNVQESILIDYLYLLSLNINAYINQHLFYN